MSLLDDLDQLEDTEVIAYKPERAGEGVEGVLVSRDITSSEYTSDDIPVLVVKDPNGVFRGIRGYHSVLRNEIVKADPQPGDTIAVKYQGKKNTKNGKGTYHAYKVLVKKGAGTSDDDEPPF